jgi:DNA-binding transcriptional ArsR family regulator
MMLKMKVVASSLDQSSVLETRSNHEISDLILKHIDELAHHFAALSHPLRLRVLCCLLNQSEQRANVSELVKATGMQQASLSQLLARMKEDGLVEGVRSGRMIFYHIPNPKIIELLKHCKDIFCQNGEEK